MYGARRITPLFRFSLVLYFLYFTNLLFRSLCNSTRIYFSLCVQLFTIILRKYHIWWTRNEIQLHAHTHMHLHNDTLTRWAFTFVFNCKARWTHVNTPMVHVKHTPAHIHIVHIRKMNGFTDFHCIAERVMFEYLLHAWRITTKFIRNEYHEHFFWLYAESTQTTIKCTYALLAFFSFTCQTNGIFCRDHTICKTKTFNIWITGLRSIRKMIGHHKSRAKWLDGLSILLNRGETDCKTTLNRFYL